MWKIIIVLFVATFPFVATALTTLEMEVSIICGSHVASWESGHVDKYEPGYEECEKVIPVIASNEKWEKEHKDQIVLGSNQLTLQRVAKELGVK